MGKIASNAKTATISTNAVARVEGPTTKSGATKIATDNLEFDLLHSAIYHDLRESWFDRVGRWFLFVTIVLGSGAASAFVAQYPLAGQIASLLVATIGALSLVFNFTGRARDHRDLKRRSYDLLAVFKVDPNNPTIRANLTKLYADEPPVEQRVNLKAHNLAGASLFGDDFNKV